MKRFWISFCLILFTITFACSDRNTPEDVAEDFIYHYYLRANQTAALRLSTALAEEKLKSEIELLRDVRKPGEAPEAQPNIKYKLIGRRFFNESVVRLKNGTEIIGVVEGNEIVAPTTITIKTRDSKIMIISGEEVDHVVEQPGVFFRYRLSIEDAENSIPSRNAVLYTELNDGHWKIVNFNEY